MSQRFVRCPHCKMPHDASSRVCPTTGRPLADPSPRVATRMSEMPPPERRPEPLGFDAKARARTGPSGHSIVTLPPTRNLQQDLIGRTVGGRYVIREILGEGGMGTVYGAEHLGLARGVAVKVLNPSQAKKRVAVKRFQQEARAAGAIGHPNICEVYDMGLLDDGSPYLVMEKLVGQTLADRIAREGGLPFDDLVEVMIQVLSGLIAAHEKGIVHRDIKPENIFLARRVGCPPVAKILDFGVSKMMPQFLTDGESLDLTRTGMVMGTPYYMSPEQARGERNLDGRVDVYACGVMMYEAIAGRRPFLAPNYNALLLSIINSTPKPLREVRPATPPALEAIVQRAMAKARDDRYPSAMHVLRDVQALALAGGGVRIPPPPTAEERARAPVAGAGRPSRRKDPPSAGAMLRQRMAEAAPPPSGRDQATRLDVKRPARTDESDSIDIPIEITGTDLPAAAPAGGLDYDDVPTAIFRPGLHPSPQSASSPTTRAPLQPRPGQARAGRQLPALVADEWDGETVVKRPSGVPPSRRSRQLDDTGRTDGSIDIDFSDETQIAPPPRRR